MSMTAAKCLEDGDEVHCPHCAHWHLVIAGSPATTTEGQVMRYVRCGGQTYFVGTLGNLPRWPVRKPALREKDEA
jgi:hypothetical protein